MNTETNNRTGLTALYAIGSLVSLLLMAGLVSWVYPSVRPKSVEASRAEQRRQFRADLDQANAEAMTNYAWIDQNKGVVQLPIQRSMELMVDEWQNPEEARQRLIQRMEKATAAPPPAEPAPNPYE